MSQSIDFKNNDFTNDYDQLCDQAIPGYRVLFDLINAYSDQLVSTQATILDIGCGTGNSIITLAKQHPHWHFTGVDISNEMLSICKSKLMHKNLLAQTELIEKSFDELHFEQKYDAAICTLTLDHIRDDGSKLTWLKNIYRSIKPGGYFFLVDFLQAETEAAHRLNQQTWKSHAIANGASKQFTDKAIEYGAEKMHFSTEQRLNELLQQAGFTAKPVTFFTCLAYKGWLIEKI